MHGNCLQQCLSPGKRLQVFLRPHHFNSQNIIFGTQGSFLVSSKTPNNNVSIHFIFKEFYVFFWVRMGICPDHCLLHHLRSEIFVRLTRSFIILFCLEQKGTFQTSSYHRSYSSSSCLSSVVTNCLFQKQGNLQDIPKALFLLLLSSSMSIQVFPPVGSCSSLLISSVLSYCILLPPLPLNVRILSKVYLFIIIV